MDIKYWREQCSFSQADLAEKIGVDSASVSRWERGKNRPSIEHLLKLQELFNRMTKGGWNERVGEIKKKKIAEGKFNFQYLKEFEKASDEFISIAKKLSKFCGIENQFIMNTPKPTFCLGSYPCNDNTVTVLFVIDQDKTLKACSSIEIIAYNVDMNLLSHLYFSNKTCRFGFYDQHNKLQEINNIETFLQTIIETVFLEK